MIWVTNIIPLTKMHSMIWVCAQGDQLKNKWEAVRLCKPFNDSPYILTKGRQGCAFRIKMGHLYHWKTTSFDRNLSFFNDIRSAENGWYIFDMIFTFGGWYMPAAYEGTDIISCLRSKYIMQRKPYIISRKRYIIFVRVQSYTQKQQKYLFHSP